MLGISITSTFSWKPHIVNLAKSASQKLGMLYRCRDYFTPEQLLSIYRGLIRPCMEYCSHIFNSSTSTYLLDRVEAKAFRLINSPTITSSFSSLSLRRDVAALSLFYRYYFGHCSRELVACVPPPKTWPRNTRQAVSAHEYCVETGHARIARYDQSFFPSTSKLWNSLPSHVFPPSYNLSLFKSQVFYHLRGASV